MDTRMLEAAIRAAEINEAEARRAARAAARPPLEGPVEFDRYTLRVTVADELKRRMAQILYTGEAGEEWMVPASTAYHKGHPLATRICSMRWCDGDIRVIRVLIANDLLGRPAPLEFESALGWLGLIVGDASVMHGWLKEPPSIDLPWQFVFHCDEAWRTVPSPPARHQRAIQSTHARIPEYVAMLARAPIES